MSYKIESHNYSLPISIRPNNSPPRSSSVPTPIHNNLPSRLDKIKDLIDQLKIVIHGADESTLEITSQLICEKIITELNSGDSALACLTKLFILTLVTDGSKEQQQLARMMIVPHFFPREFEQKRELESKMAIYMLNPPQVSRPESRSEARIEPKISIVNNSPKENKPLIKVEVSDIQFADLKARIANIIQQTGGLAELIKENKAVIEDLVKSLSSNSTDEEKKQLAKSYFDTFTSISATTTDLIKGLNKAENKAIKFNRLFDECVLTVKSLNQRHTDFLTKIFKELSNSLYYCMEVVKHGYEPMTGALWSSSPYKAANMSKIHDRYVAKEKDIEIVDPFSNIHFSDLLNEHAKYYNHVNSFTHDLENFIGEVEKTRKTLCPENFHFEAKKELAQTFPKLFEIHHDQCLDIFEKVKNTNDKLTIIQNNLSIKISENLKEIYKSKSLLLELHNDLFRDYQNLDTIIYKPNESRMAKFNLMTSSTINKL